MERVVRRGGLPVWFRICSGEQAADDPETAEEEAADHRDCADGGGFEGAEDADGHAEGDRQDDQDQG